MEIINENYICLVFEFPKENKKSIKEYRSSLIGNTENLKKIKGKKKPLIIHNLPDEINREFIKKIQKYEKLDSNLQYLNPIDFSIIKRVIHTYKTGNKTRYTNKPVGIITLYKYLGPFTYIKDLLFIIKEKIDKWKGNDRDIFFNIQETKIILGSELDYLEKIINHNYFITYFEFSNENADPNDFRRSLLGLKRNYRGEEIDFHPNIPKFINKFFIDKIREKYKEKLDERVEYILPMDFSIIKRPILLYKSEDGKKKVSDLAVGVIMIYKFTGLLEYINEFKTIFKKTFSELRKERDLNNHFKELKNYIFKKANNPLIIIGAELEFYKDF